MTTTAGDQVWGNLRRIGYFARLIWRSGRVRALALGLSTVVTGVLPAVAAWLTKIIIDSLGADTHRPVSGAAIALLAIIGLGAASLPHLSRYLQSELGRSLDLITQNELYSAVNRLSGLALLERPEFRDRLSLAEQGSGLALSPAVTSLFGTVRDLVSTVGLLGALVAVSPVMAALVVLVSVPALVAQIALSRQRVTMAAEISPATRRRFFFRSLLIDVQVAKEIRLFGLGRFLQNRMLAETRTAQREQRRMDRYELRTQWSLAVLQATLYGVALIWAVRQTSTDRLTLGDLSVFLAATVGLQASLNAVVIEIASGYQTLSLFRHFIEMTTALDDDLRPAAGFAKLPLPNGAGIQLRNVWFRYADDKPWVLRGINLSIPLGAIVALVGINGAGKSTLIKLICRMYDPVEGVILWDGVDIRNVPVTDLRRRIGAVFQDFVTYDLTARENIGVGDIDRMGEQALVEAAALQAGVHRQLRELPFGYDTMISQTYAAAGGAGDGRSGIALSGGQRQRLALARAFLRRDCDLLILDEPSAALDARAERDIHDRLMNIRAGRSILLISHRLNTVRSADVIVVLINGRVAETGSHEELIAANGEYAKLFAVQAAGYTAL